MNDSYSLSAQSTDLPLAGLLETSSPPKLSNLRLKRHRNMNLSSENFRKFFGAISRRDRYARLRNVCSDSGHSKTSPVFHIDGDLEQNLTDPQKAISSPRRAEHSCVHNCLRMSA